MSDKTNSGFFAFLAGGMIGAVIGIILAPKPGKETREELSEGFYKAREKFEDIVENFDKKVHEAIDRFKQEHEL
jgi:gas vesicle protein